MTDVERYEEALLWLQGRMEWGISETVAHFYAAAIERLFSGMTWDEALDFGDDEE